MRSNGKRVLPSSRSGRMMPAGTGDPPTGRHSFFPSLSRGSSFAPDCTTNNEHERKHETEHICYMVDKDAAARPPGTQQSKCGVYTCLMQVGNQQRRGAYHDAVMEQFAVGDVDARESTRGSAFPSWRERARHPATPRHPRHQRPDARRRAGRNAASRRKSASGRNVASRRRNSSRWALAFL